MILVGIAAIAAGWFYTGGPRPYGYAGFGELFVFVFFGLVAVVFSTFVQIERLTWLSVGCGVAIGCLATALLVVNNLRDISGDAAAGKRTLAVRMGDRGTRFLYVGLIVVAMVLVPVIAGFGGRPVAALALVSVFAARRPVVDVLRRRLRRGPAPGAGRHRTGRAVVRGGAGDRARDRPLITASCGRVAPRNARTSAIVAVGASRWAA